MKTLDGKKTYIGFACLALSKLCFGLAGDLPELQNTFMTLGGVLEVGFYFFAPVGIIDKLRKGELKVK